MSREDKEVKCVLELKLWVFVSTIVIVRKELINQVRHNINKSKFNLRMVGIYVMPLRMQQFYNLLLLWQHRFCQEHSQTRCCTRSLTARQNKSG